MKILYHHRIASKDGQYVHVEELTTALKKQGNELFFVEPSNMNKAEFGDNAGLVDKLKDNIPAFVYELLEFGYSFFAFIKLCIAVYKYKPDFIYERYNLYLPAGTWVKKLFKIPLLLEVNAPLFEERKEFNGIAIPRLAKWTERYVWRNADQVLAVTEVLGKIISSEGVDNQKITVIPNGINLDRFSEKLDSSIIKTKLGIDKKLVLGFTGFVREWHRLDLVLILLKDNPSRHLLVVGDGPAASTIQNRARELGVEKQLTITGIVKRNNVAEYVSAFDIALQSDVTDYASPLKLFEYMILGKAIIAPDKENIKEVLTNNINAVFYEHNNINCLLESIERLCNDDELRNNLGNQARKTVIDKGYTWDANARLVCEIAQTIIQSDYS